MRLTKEQILLSGITLILCLNVLVYQRGIDVKKTEIHQIWDAVGGVLSYTQSGSILILNHACPRSLDIIGTDSIHSMDFPVGGFLKYSNPFS